MILEFTPSVFASIMFALVIVLNIGIYYALTELYVDNCMCIMFG